MNYIKKVIVRNENIKVIFINNKIDAVEFNLFN